VPGSTIVQIEPNAARLTLLSDRLCLATERENPVVAYEIRKKEGVERALPFARMAAETFLQRSQE